MFYDFLAYPFTLDQLVVMAIALQQNTAVVALLIAVCIFSFIIISHLNYADFCGNERCDPGENGCNCNDDCGGGCSKY